MNKLKVLIYLVLILSVVFNSCTTTRTSGSGQLAAKSKNGHFVKYKKSGRVNNLFAYKGKKKKSKFKNNQTDYLNQKDPLFKTNPLNQKDSFNQTDPLFKTNPLNQKDSFNQTDPLVKTDPINQKDFLNQTDSLNKILIVEKPVSILNKHKIFTDRSGIIVEKYLLNDREKEEK